VPVAANTEGADITEVSLAALALGMVFVGTCNDEVLTARTILHFSAGEQTSLSHIMSN
jgi:hypothetical protein